MKKTGSRYAGTGFLIPERLTNILIKRIYFAASMMR